ncbi:MAG: hypothetical protein WKF65_18060 [Gaiellaceae bacterium]
MASLAPGLERREAPEDVAEVLAWASFPLATQEGHGHLARRRRRGAGGR